MSRTPDPILEALHGLELFAGLRERDLKRIAGDMRTQRLDAGKTVMMEHHHGEEFLVIVEGEVEVVRDGERLATLGPGDFLGEAGVMTGGDRNATVRSLSKVRLLAMDGAAFREVRSRHPSIATRVDAEARRRRPA